MGFFQKCAFWALGIFGALDNLQFGIGRSVPDLGLVRSGEKTGLDLKTRLAKKTHSSSKLLTRIKEEKINWILEAVYKMFPNSISSKFL